MRCLIAWPKFELFSEVLNAESKLNCLPYPHNSAPPRPNPGVPGHANSYNFGVTEQGTRGVRVGQIPPQPEFPGPASSYSFGVSG